LTGFISNTEKLVNAINILGNEPHKIQSDFYQKGLNILINDINELRTISSTFLNTDLPDLNFKFGFNQSK